MKKFIKVLDAVIDTDWLVSSILTEEGTCLKIRQSSDLTLEFRGKSTVNKIFHNF